MKALGFLAAMFSLSGPHYWDPPGDRLVFIDLVDPQSRRGKRIRRRARNARKRRRGWA